MLEFADWAQIMDSTDVAAKGYFGQAATELVDTDLSFRDTVDSQGKTYPVYQANMVIALQNPDRERRRTAWESYFDGYLSMENTLASIYLANVKQWMVLAEVWGDDSVLAMKLSPTKLPLDVLHNLIDTFKKHLQTWHRYWDVKAKILGIDAMRPYDIWASPVNNPPAIPYKQSVE